MNKITVLDLTLVELNKLTNTGKLATIEDLLLNLKIEKNILLRALDYLQTLCYCEKNNNAYQITFEGEYFISKNSFIIKTKPFTFEYFYKQLKVIVLILNTLLVLLLGWLNYSVNKSKIIYQNVDSKASDSTIISKSKIFKTTTIKLNTSKKINVK